MLGRLAVPVVRDVRVLRIEDDQPGFGLVGNVGTAFRTDVNPIEVPPRPLVLGGGPEPLPNLLMDLVEAQVSGPVGGEPGDRLLGREPVPLPIDVQVHRPVRQSGEGVSERSRALSRLGTSQLDVPAVEPPLSRVKRRGGPEEDRSGNPATCRVPAEVRVLLIEDRGH